MVFQRKKTGKSTALSVRAIAAQVILQVLDQGKSLSTLIPEVQSQVKPQDFQYINYNIHQGTSENNDSRDAANEYKNNPIQTDAKNASKKIYKLFVYSRQI